MAEPDIVPELYAELRRRADRLLRSHQASLRPGSLVHEALIKLWQADPDRWESEAHFRASASLAMRQVLIDRARRRSAAKRGHDPVRVTLTGLGEDHHILDIVVLHEALERLEAAHPRCGRVVTLKVFGGLELAEIADILDISASTVKRDWRVGRAWLATAMQ